jgi:hypothetical protein
MKTQKAVILRGGGTNREAGSVSESRGEAVDMSEKRPNRVRSGSLLGAIATDIHFWIPVAVLVAGLVLLHRMQ